MKIHFDGIEFNARTGPSTFGTRLAKSFFESGHEIVVNDGRSADVSLVFIEPSGRPLAKKVVQRLDGIWFKPNEFHTKNVGIKKLYDVADKIVWQSEFDKGMTQHHWGARSGVVIHNGANVPQIKKFSSSELESIRNRYKLVLVSSANWHPQKRLQANFDLYKHIKRTIEPSTCFIVMGSNPSTLPADIDVFFTGSLPEPLYLEIFAMADWMLHLARLDHCPNTVVEALSQQTPVICADSGGTKELVKGFGIVLNESNKYEFGLEDYDSPPNIDVTQVTQLPLKSTLSTPLDVSMHRVTDAYIELFRSMM